MPYHWATLVWVGQVGLAPTKLSRLVYSQVPLLLGSLPQRCPVITGSRGQKPCPATIRSGETHERLDVQKKVLVRRIDAPPPNPRHDDQSCALLGESTPHTSQKRNVLLLTKARY